MNAPSDDELRALLAAATPGPWWVSARATIRAGGKHDGLWVARSHWRNQKHNTALIAAAPALAAEVLRLRAEIAQARRDGAAEQKRMLLSLMEGILAGLRLRYQKANPEQAKLATLIADSIQRVLDECRALPLPGDPT